MGGYTLNCEKCLQAMKLLLLREISSKEMKYYQLYTAKNIWVEMRKLFEKSKILFQTEWTFITIEYFLGKFHSILSKFHTVLSKYHTILSKFLLWLQIFPLFTQYWILIFCSVLQSTRVVNDNELALQLSVQWHTACSRKSGPQHKIKCCPTNSLLKKVVIFIWLSCHKF